MKRSNAIYFFVIYFSITIINFLHAEKPDAFSILKLASQDSAKPYFGKVISKMKQGSTTIQTKVFIKVKSPQKYKKDFFTNNGKLERTVFADKENEWIYFPMKNMIWKGDVKKSQEKLISEDKEWELINNNYNLELKQGEKIAKRNTWVLNIIPKDKGKPYRTLWIDQDENVILKNKEFYPDGLLAEESFFEEITFPELPESIPIAFQIPTKAKIKEHGYNPDFMSLEKLKESGIHYPYFPEHIPVGFVFESADFFTLKGKEISHLRFTDGLNVISLFESADPVSTKSKDFNWQFNELESTHIGFSKSGKVLHWKLKNRYLTLVGNLSLELLQKISHSIK